MESKEKLVNLFMVILAPAAIFTIAWAVMGLDIHKIDSGVITVVTLTVFCSCYLRIQLPRVSIHLTISDSLVILAMLLYGGEVAVLLSIIEMGAGSIYMRRQHVTIRAKTILINILVAPIGVFATAKVIDFIFGSVDRVLQRGDFTSFVWLLAVMAASLFLVNSALVAVITAIRQKRSITKVWVDNCFDALLMYVVGAGLAGVIVKALDQINLYLFAAVFLVCGVIYVTFRRFVDDLHKTVEKAKEAERERAEQAEKHVGELQHYVAELERSG